MRTLNEIFTLEREVNFSIGENCFLTKLDGGLILLEEDIIEDESYVGAPQRKTFTFQCLSAGTAYIQFAWQHFPGGPFLYEEVLPVEIVNSDVKPGGWSGMHEVTSKEFEVFRVAMDAIIGVGYIPLSASKQVVNGVNYKFICEVQKMAHEAEKYYAMVYIYDAPDEPRVIDPIVTKIVPFLK